MTVTLAELTQRVARVSDIYARRCDIRRDDDWYALKLQEEAGELVAAYLKLTGRGRTGETGPAERRSAMADEVADLLAQLLLFARHHEVDVLSALDSKWFVHLRGES
ncbi:MAG: phosphoribosyl-ATP pyrophosphohydrolase [Devosia sp.]|nr:phosphoribosyl-ATP pyrophosphohydrolase [Devosia sp.]